MTNRQEVKDYVEQSGISLYKISKQTKLCWQTVYNYIKTDLAYSSVTENKIINYLNAIKL